MTKRSTFRAALAGVVAATLAVPPVTAQTQSDGLRVSAAQLPPNPRPGECYALVFVPGDVVKEPQRVLAQEEAETIAVSPAEYQWVEKDIEIEGPAEKIEVVPARFEVQRREIVIEPERREVTVTPPRWETVDQPVLVREAYQTWRPGAGALQRYDNATGTLMSLVTVPPEYRTVKVRRLVEPARLITKIIPAKTRTIDVRVMVERPRRRVILIPGKTKRMRVLEQVTPMRTTRTPIPAQYQTVVLERGSNEGRLEWRQTICDNGTSVTVVRDLQRALRRRGFDPGPIDGKLGSRTMAAVSRFQRENRLSEGGVTLETLEALGVSPSG